MTYQERKSIMLAIATITVSIIYYTVFKEKFISPNLEQAELLKQWAKFIIIFIPVQIVVNIIVTIISYIATNISDSIKQGGAPVENDYEIVDELDKQVDLKSLQVSTSVFALSVLGGIATLIFYAPISTMFNMFFFGIVLRIIYCFL